jgi:acetyl esterase/lipase
VITKVREANLAATFSHPDGAGPFPAIVALGGSDGGTPEYFLNLLVPEGFAVLALVYWGTPETQMTLADVPVERVERALRWLRVQPNVRAANGRVGIVGASKGAELALVAASTLPDLVGPVVAYTPSSVVWMGLDFMSPGRLCSSWSQKGSPLPFVPFPPGVTPAQSERGLSMLPVAERGLDDRAAVERAAIPVDRARGRLLLVSGSDDRVWPAKRMCDMIVARMSAHGRQDDVKHLHYADAGHMLFPYTRPSDVTFPALPMDVGGTPQADADAHASAWPQVVAHLRGE